jgi:hypothetical protein
MVRYGKKLFDIQRYRHVDENTVDWPAAIPVVYLQIGHYVYLCHSTNGKWNWEVKISPEGCWLQETVSSGTETKGVFLIRESAALRYFYF